MVGQYPLKVFIGVRIPDRQPFDSFHSLMAFGP